MLDNMEKKYPEKPEAVYYFGTCLAESFYPDAGMAGIKLLQREGVRVIFPSGQTCCGQPAYNAGFLSETRAVAEAQIKLFSKPLPIVVPSGSCAGMMRHQYPELFADAPNIDSVREFSERVFELSEFLVHVLDIKLEDRGDPMKVTWHSSCHAKREMNVIEDSKSLIRQLKNVELVELENEHECCGFGGTFSVKHPQISGAMVRDKVADIRKTGAPLLLAGDCGCMMNIAGNIAHQKLPIESRHLAEFLWERTHG
jgi:L-lactate dehydrogenase complex protein LldE